ncbi:MAG: hypothetical protein K2W95_02170 [Candidatus Obscuribacterales bacterium]|nr:hypothetical protein [Candidatus Obscuribacterales bacterium]
MSNKKMTIAVAFSALFCLSMTVPAEAKDDAFKAANRAAVQMWLNQQASKGLIYPDPYTAGQALQFHQQTGIDPAYGSPGYYNNYNPYRQGLNYGYPYYGF